MNTQKSKKNNTHSKPKKTSTSTPSTNSSRTPKPAHQPSLTDKPSTANTTTSMAPPPPSRKRGIESISSSKPTSNETAKPAPEQSAFDITFPPDLTQSTPNPNPNSNPKSNPNPNLKSHPTTTTANQISISSSHLLRDNNNFTTTCINITSSTSITNKVTSALTHLSSHPSTTQPPPVIVFSAKGDAAGKMISIVEIVKRNIATGAGKWFEYVGVEGRVLPLPSREVKVGKKARKVEGKGSDEEMDDGDEEEEGEDGFEIMKTPFERMIEGRTKVRSVPVMTIYLARVRIDELRKKFGEQTNAEPARDS